MFNYRKPQQQIQKDIKSIIYHFYLMLPQCETMNILELLNHFQAFVEVSEIVIF